MKLIDCYGKCTLFDYWVELFLPFVVTALLIMAFYSFYLLIKIIHEGIKDEN